MGRWFIKLDDKIMEWSSVSDSPRTPLLTEKQFLRYWKEEYGRDRATDLGETMAHLKTKGISSSHTTINETIKGNRAGKGEKPLTKAQIIEAYTFSNDSEFEEWCKKRDKYADDTTAEWEKLFSERNKKST
jgi:hypothetical protein